MIIIINTFLDQNILSTLLNIEIDVTTRIIIIRNENMLKFLEGSQIVKSCQIHAGSGEKLENFGNNFRLPVKNIDNKYK